MDFACDYKNCPTELEVTSAILCPVTSMRGVNTITRVIDPDQQEIGLLSYSGSRGKKCV